MYPHRIRLRGPWQCVAPAETQPRRVTVPCRLIDLGLDNMPVVLTRDFGYPGRIDDHERVWLTLEHVKGVAQLTLNGQALGEARDGCFEVDATSLLGPHNHLEISVQGQEVGEMAMEVRASAFLQGVSARRTAAGKLDVRGLVAGSCEDGLELYVLVDGRTALYRPIRAGESFTAALEAPGRNLRLELVLVSTVWYRVDLVVP
jgi:hypothetical protein